MKKLNIPSYSILLSKEKRIRAIQELYEKLSGIFKIVPDNASESNPLTDKSYVDSADSVIQEEMQENQEQVETALAGKQDSLVSGENIKTINGESILGDGDLELATDVPKHVILSQSEYDALQTKERNTIYLIVAGTSEGWTFGNSFPVILS